MKTAPLLALLAAPLLASDDFTGTWLGKDIAFKFAQHGSALTGKMYGDSQSTPVTQAAISGNLITFIVNIQEQAGNQINDTRMRFTGKIDNGELELIRERESSTNAGNGGAVHIKPGPKQTYRLSRLP